MGSFLTPARTRARDARLELADAPPAPRLLPRQAAFLKLYAQGLTGAKAYRQAYNPKASAEVAGAAASRLLAKGAIRDYLDQFRAETFHLVRQTYIDAIQTAMIPIYGRGRNGRRVIVGERPDWRTRTEAAEALAKLHGLYP
jgi:hypothetical protein